MPFLLNVYHKVGVYKKLFQNQDIENVLKIAFAWLPCGW